MNDDIIKLFEEYINKLEGRIKVLNKKLKGMDYDIYSYYAGVVEGLDFARISAMVCLDTIREGAGL